jgi:hypothetical protein
LLGSKRRRDQDPMIVGRLRVVGARNTTCTSMKPVACDQRIYEFLLTFFRSRSKSSEHGRNEYGGTAARATKKEHVLLNINNIIILLIYIILHK